MKWNDLTPADRAASEPYDLGLAHALRGNVAPLATVRAESPRPTKPHTSQYVGVSRRYTGWRGVWSIEGRQIIGHIQRAEEAAAWDRARALGRDWLEVRG